jgi:hypothetical protein
MKPRLAVPGPRRLAAQSPPPAVPRSFPGATLACVAGGPSVTQADVDALRGRVPVIAVNDAYKLAPWADVLYACDAKWWAWHQGVPSYAGPKYSIDRNAGRWPGVQVLRNTGTRGLELAPTGLRTGRNSGYQAINLAAHLGAARVLLLGYDMGPAPDGRTHWFGLHPDKVPSPYGLMLHEFQGFNAELLAAGVTVLNCSRRTVLQEFPRVALEEELARLQVPQEAPAC